MRGLLIFIMLLLALGFFAVVSEAQVVEGSEPMQIFPQVAGNGGIPVEAFVPLVDRADDPELTSNDCTEAPGDCSLRAAIAKAQERSQAVTITFADHYLINLTRPLPTLTLNGLNIIAQTGQEVRINGNNLGAPVFHITAANVRLEGLRIFGAGPGSPIILVNGPAQKVTIARNIIGDDDGPEGMCDPNTQAIAGIYLQPSPEEGAGARAWIYGNIIECILGYPGDGVVIKSDGIVVGADAHGQATEAQRNVIRGNNGFAVRLDDYSGNTVRNNLIHHNLAGAIAMTNFANNLMDNDIRQ